jgi:hypothetical protein
MKTFLLLWTRRFFTCVQIVACLWCFGLVAVIAGSTPFTGSGAATWDGFDPALPGGRWFACAGAATLMLWIAESAKRLIARLDSQRSS